MKVKKKRVLSIRDLNISFITGSGIVNAIRGVRLDLFKGEKRSRSLVRVVVGNQLQ